MGDAPFGTGAQEAAIHHSPIPCERFAGNAAHLNYTVEKEIDLRLRNRRAGCKDDVVGGINDLGLIPGVGLKLLTEHGIAHHKESVGLETEGRWGEHKGLLKTLPGSRWDFLRRIEGLGGVAPVQGVEKLGFGNGVGHGIMR